MPARFDTTGANKELRRGHLPHAQWEPRLWIGGDPLLGFEATYSPPKLGYWGVTVHDKQINAAMLDSGNIATWIFNNVIDPLVPGDQRFVALGPGLLMREQFKDSKPVNGWLALSRQFSPVQNVKDIDRRLEFNDINFDPDEATDRWLKQASNGRLLVMAQGEGFDLEGMLRNSRNLDHFVYTQNRILAHAQAMQSIREFEDKAGLAVKWTSRVHSMAQNYLLTDPTVLPSMFLPFGWARTAGSSIKIGVKAKSLTAPIFGRRFSLASGKAVAALAPEALHAGMATHIGHRAAVAVEMAAFGGVFDLAIQAERMEQSEILFDDPDHQQHFSWAELGLAVGIGTLGGFVFAGKGGKSLRETRKAVTEVAGGGPESPIAHSLDNVQGQGRLDVAAIRVQRAAQAVLGNDADLMTHYLDPRLLAEVGLTPLHVAEAMEQLAGALEGKTLPPNVVMQVLADLFTEAGETRAARNIIEEAIGSEMERAAFAVAMARASRAAPKATNQEVLEAARRFVPEELEKLEAAQKSRATAVIPAQLTELEYWLNEATVISTLARTRNLSQAELDYIGTIRGKLASQNWPDPFEGLARRLSERWADGTVFNPLRARTGSPLSRALSKVITEQENVGRAVDKKSRVNAQARLRRAKKAMSKAAGETPEVSVPKATTEAQLTVRRVMAKWRADPPKNRAQRLQALEEIYTSTDFNHNALIEDGNVMGKIIQGWGLARWFRTIATSGTGMNQTTRSTLAFLREIAHEFDNNKLRVGDLDPRRLEVHRTIMDLRVEIDVKVGEVIDELARLHAAGKWGNSFLHPWKYMKSRRDFDTQVIRHIADDTFTSTDKDVIKSASLWQKHAESIGDLGEAAGLLPNRVKGKRFFPRRWNTGIIGKNESAFVDDLAEHFAKGWEKADIVHLDTLVAMGKAARAPTDGVTNTFPGWVIPGRKGVVKSLKRSELSALGVDENTYLKAMREIDPEDGFTPMSRSAKQAAARLQGEDSYEQLPNGKIRPKRHGSPRSEQDRAIEETVWSNPKLHKYLDFRFAHGVSSYMSSTGMRVMNAARHQERWGVPGLTMEETLDFLESRLVRLPGDHASKEQWQTGINTLREKLHLAEGRLPTLRDHTNKLLEFLSATGQAAAGALYGGGIGGAILATEVSQVTLGRLNMNPAVIAQRAGAVFKAVRRGQELRETMQTIGLTVRQYRLHTLERLTGGALYSEGFQFAVTPKLLAPWMDVWLQLTGRTASSGGAALGRAGAAPAAVRAAAGNFMTIGGMDWWTQMARMTHVQSMLDETGRFFKAAEKSAVALRESADLLDDIERKAREKVLAGAVNLTPEIEQKALKAGRNARMKEWVSIVRKNGFGKNWQVAERMARAKLLIPERLAILRKAGEETGALRDTGIFKTFDWNELQKYETLSAAEFELFDSAKRSLRDSMVQTLHKRVSEQSLMQTPTSPTARSSLGGIYHSMTSFARSWYDNNILDTAQMPLHVGTAMLATYMFGETLNRTMRDLWRGRDLEDILADIEADPDNYIARTITNIPLLGQYSMLNRPLADALTLDGRMRKVDTGESAAEGAFGALTDVIFDSIHGVSPLAEDAEIQTRTWRTAARLIPGYRSWWAMLLTQGLEATTGVDLPGMIEGGGRYRKYGQQKFDIPETPQVGEGELNVGPKFPEDISFTYSQE